MKNQLFKEIEQDHEAVREILDQIVDTDDASTQERERLFTQLKEELQPHMKAEERVLYPELKNKREAREDSLEAIEEHHVAELVMRELDSTRKGTEEWKAKCVVFQEILDHHIEEEESRIFDDTQSAFSNDEIEEIHQRFREEKQNLKQEFSRSNR